MTVGVFEYFRASLQKGCPNALFSSGACEAVAVTTSNYTVVNYYV